jgi:hypothetical protein
MAWLCGLFDGFIDKIGVNSARLRVGKLQNGILREREFLE